MVKWRDTLDSESSGEIRESSNLSLGIFTLQGCRDMKKAWIIGLLVVGCVAEPVVGVDTEYLGTVVMPPPEENPNNGILIPSNMIELELENSADLSLCVCEWEIWETDGMICLGEVCSETCELSRCREAVDICQPL